MEIYEYSVERPDGTTQPLSAYEGKVLLIVNTATGCGFTPQYRELEEFYRKYHDKGLEIFRATSSRDRRRGQMRRSTSSAR